MYEKNSDYKSTIKESQAKGISKLVKVFSSFLYGIY